MAGPEVYICDECIDLSASIVGDEVEVHAPAEPPKRRRGRRSNASGPSCSFCGKAADEVARLVDGPGGVHVCNECIDLSAAIIAADPASAGEKPAGSDATAPLRRPSCPTCRRVVATTASVVTMTVDEVAVRLLSCRCGTVLGTV